jgi:hypothetical protein
MIFGPHYGPDDIMSRGGYLVVNLSYSSVPSTLSEICWLLKDITGQKHIPGDFQWLPMREMEHYRGGTYSVIEFFDLITFAIGRFRVKAQEKVRQMNE